jgi:hypothetical protein
VLSACSDKELRQKVIYTYEDKEEKEIDSLLAQEQNTAARNKAFAVLNNLSRNNYRKLSFLYNRIGKSYNFSLHFDSAVYYTKMAYNLSLKLNDNALQAKRGTNLLAVYNKSAIYSAEQEKMFHVINDIDKSTLDIRTQALIYNVLTEYYQRTQRYEMCLYLPTQELALYKKYLQQHIPTHEDSTYMALCYMHISDALTVPL